MDLSGWLSGVSQKVVADFLKWVVSTVGAPVIAWLRSRNLRWATLILDTIVGWVCLYILFYGLSTEAITSAAWWVYILAVVSLVFFVVSDWRRSKQVTAPASVMEVEPPSPAPVSARDEANKKKIDDVFRAHGKPASEHIQKIAAELYEQLNGSESREKQAIAEITQKSLSIPCAFTCNTLSRALKEKKDSFPMLQRDLEDFFLAYFRLVLCVQTIDGLLERSVPPDKTRILWQNDHKLFLDDLRELFAEEDFSTSRVRMKEGQHGPSN